MRFEIKDDKGMYMAGFRYYDDALRFSLGILRTGKTKYVEISKDEQQGVIIELKHINQEFAHELHEMEKQML